MKLINHDGIKNYYYIDTFGNVYSKFKGQLKTLKLDIDKDGYYRTSLQTDRGRYSYRINRLMGFTYLKNENNYPIVHHKDGNKQNNNVDNLEWTTISNNTKMGYLEKNYHFTKKILAMKDGEIIHEFDSIKDCANYYNIHYSSISAIANLKEKPRKRGKIKNLKFVFAKEGVSTIETTL